jgi:hypothetical protein
MAHGLGQSFVARLIVGVAEADLVPAITSALDETPERPAGAEFTYEPYSLESLRFGRTR